MRTGKAWACLQAFLICVSTFFLLVPWIGFRGLGKDWVVFEG